jgi:hypothetical protein
MVNAASHTASRNINSWTDCLQLLWGFGTFSGQAAWRSIGIYQVWGMVSSYRILNET